MVARIRSFPFAKATTFLFSYSARFCQSLSALFFYFCVTHLCFWQSLLVPFASSYRARSPHCINSLFTWICLFVKSLEPKSILLLHHLMRGDHNTLVGDGVSPILVYNIPFDPIHSKHRTCLQVCLLVRSSVIVGLRYVPPVSWADMTQLYVLNGDKRDNTWHHHNSNESYYWLPFEWSLAGVQRQLLKTL